MRYEFRQCTDQGCRFRYPAPNNNDSSSSPCPRCGALTAIVAEVPRSDPIPASEIANSMSGPHVEALLDNIRSIYNVGSIFRTADGAGLRRLHLCGITPTPDHPKVAKTALGAEEVIPWQAHNNAVDALSALKVQGYIVVALEESGGVERNPGFLKKPGLSEKLILVVGNEIAGIDPDVLALADHHFAIPMRGVKRSLNVATAFGIAAYALTSLTG